MFSLLVLFGLIIMFLLALWLIIGDRTIIKYACKIVNMINIIKLNKKNK